MTRVTSVAAICAILSKSSTVMLPVVLGLIAWLYLQAQLTLYAVQINVVRAYRLWPRSLAPPPYTEQDRHAFRLYVEKRGDQYDIVAGGGGEDDRKKTSG